jgi:hypothetical protein
MYLQIHQLLSQITMVEKEYTKKINQGPIITSIHTTWYGYHTYSPDNTSISFTDTQPDNPISTNINLFPHMTATEGDKRRINELKKILEIMDFTNSSIRRTLNKTRLI